jgi:hypothetical protein
VREHDATGQRSRGPATIGNRIRAGLAALRIRRDERRARRDEALALEKLGEAVARAKEPLGDGTGALFEEVAARESTIRAAEALVASSLHDDREDYRTVSPLLRPVVIARGVAARAVLREKLRLVRAQHARAQRALGEAALARDGALPGEAATRATAAREARDRVISTSGEAEALLAPYGGSALPGPMRHLGNEAAHFARPLASEIRGQLLPRWPALAGLAAGWWVARTFTDSQFWATLHSLGIGGGPKRAVSARTLHALGFWLPLVTAAFCSYAGNRLGELIHRRYAPEPRIEPAGSRMSRPS